MRTMPQYQKYGKLLYECCLPSSYVTHDWDSLTLTEREAYTKSAVKFLNRLASAEQDTEVVKHGTNITLVTPTEKFDPFDL